MFGGAPTWERKAVALSFDVEEAAAWTVCEMSVTLRVLESMRRSFVKAIYMTIF